MDKVILQGDLVHDGKYYEKDQEISFKELEISEKIQLEWFDVGFIKAVETKAVETKAVKTKAEK